MYSIVAYEGPFPSKEHWYPEFIALYETFFGAANTNEFQLELPNKRKPLLLLALSNESVLGFKLGYEENTETFYSWVGGVSESHRKLGIGNALMSTQHEVCATKGYKRIRTKTKNKFRNMLILNIRNGFNIVGTYTDGSGEPKIMLEKPL